MYKILKFIYDKEKKYVTCMKMGQHNGQLTTIRELIQEMFEKNKCLPGAKFKRVAYIH